MNIISKDRTSEIKPKLISGMRMGQKRGSAVNFYNLADLKRNSANSRFSKYSSVNNDCLSNLKITSKSNRIIKNKISQPKRKLLLNFK